MCSIIISDENKGDTSLSPTVEFGTCEEYGLSSVIRNCD